MQINFDESVYCLEQVEEESDEFGTSYTARVSVIDEPELELLFYVTNAGVGMIDFGDYKLIFDHPKMGEIHVFGYGPESEQAPTAFQTEWIELPGEFYASLVGKGFWEKDDITDTILDFDILMDS